MALQSKREELLAAWRALAGNQEGDGWRTIPVAYGGECRFLAGRHFPGNEEALLVGFSAILLPPVNHLPEGRGFLVSSVSLPKAEEDRVWVALCRQSVGNLDFFAMMIDDVVTTLQGFQGEDDQKLFNMFLARIRAWQDFMRRGDDGVLSPEAEVGLFGELEFLQDLLLAGLQAAMAVEAWQGPLDGVQDFFLGTGAIEIKSTVSPSGFPASIASLDQLDDSLTRPIFLAGIQLALMPSGRTLSEQVAELRSLMASEPAVLNLFDTRLLHAGFFEVTADCYTRRFCRVATRILYVTDGFPRLTRANVASEIRRAHYEIDLDLITTDNLEIRHVLEQLGMIQ